jgi:hypothetical protein
MMMHVMFVDMNFMDKWRDHDCNMVHKIVRVDVALVSRPAHVEPTMTAAVYIYLGARGNDRLHLVARRGPRSQIEIRSCARDGSLG